MATATATGTKARAKTGAAAPAGGAAGGPRPRWATMPPAQGLLLEHDAGNRYRILGADGKIRQFTGREMARVLEELRPANGVPAAARAKSGPRSSGSRRGTAGK